MEQYCYFIKLTPKSSLIDYPTDHLKLFNSFLAKISVSKAKLVISFFEIWFPGIGLKLIDQGYSIFTRFDNLEIEGFIKIFDFLMKEENDAFVEILTTTNL